MFFSAAVASQDVVSAFVRRTVVVTLGVRPLHLTDGGFALFAVLAFLAVLGALGHLSDAWLLVKVLDAVVGVDCLNATFGAVSAHYEQTFPTK